MLKKRPFKITFTGPESTGKTTLAKLCANQYNGIWLPEYARAYLKDLDQPYVAKDLLKIANGQFASEQQILKENPNQQYIFLDTSLLVIKVWSIFKYGFYNIQLEKLLLANLPDLYFLCDWQIPWEYDPLREGQHDRPALYEIYLKEIKELNVPFYELKGTVEERMNFVRDILSQKFY